VKPTLQ
jgi:hypothetical protein